MPSVNRYILTSNGNFYLVPSGTELYHHGVKGQKWGVRRYQNKDGSLTPAGKKRAAKLSQKLDDTRLMATQRYRGAISGADVARTGETLSDRRRGKTYGIRSMDRATQLDRQISKFEKRLKNMGVDPKKDQELIEARQRAGEYYVKRSKGVIAADWGGQVVLNAGSMFVQAALGSPLPIAMYTAPNTHKLKKSIYLSAEELLGNGNK